MSSSNMPTNSDSYMEEGLGIVLIRLKDTQWYVLKHYNSHKLRDEQVFLVL